MQIKTGRNFGPPPPVMQPADRPDCDFSPRVFNSSSRNVPIRSRFSESNPESLEVYIHGISFPTAGDRRPYSLGPHEGMRDCWVGRLSGASPDMEPNFGFRAPARSISMDAGSVLPRAVDRDHRRRQHTGGFAGLELGPVLWLTWGHAAALRVLVLAIGPVWPPGSLPGSGVPGAAGTEFPGAPSRCFGSSWSSPSPDAAPAVSWSLLGLPRPRPPLGAMDQPPVRLGAVELPMVAGLDERGWRPSGGMGNVIGLFCHGFMVDGYLGPGSPQGGVKVGPAVGSRISNVFQHADIWVRKPLPARPRACCQILRRPAGLQ